MYKIYKMKIRYKIEFKMFKILRNKMYKYKLLKKQNIKYQNIISTSCLI